MTILECAPYIKGTKFMSTTQKERYRATASTLEDAYRFLNRSVSGTANLQRLNSFDAFCKAEPDLAAVASATSYMLEEFFYGIKLGYVSPQVPAKTLYLANQVYKTYGSLNYLSKCLSRADLNEMFRKGHVVEGYSLRDVFKTFIQPDYEPLEEAYLKVPREGAYDVYIETLDNVIIIPKDIGDLLSDSDISRIIYNNKDVLVGNKPLRFLCNRLGVNPNVYDYRSLI